MQRLRAFRTRETAPRETATEPPRTDAVVQPGHDPGFEAGVQVIYGAGLQSLPLVGLRVADARPLVETILGIDPRSPALVNGQAVRQDYVIARGDTLEFVHHAGEKGAYGRSH